MLCLCWYTACTFHRTRDGSRSSQLCAHPAADTCRPLTENMSHRKKQRKKQERKTKEKRKRKNREKQEEKENVKEKKTRALEGFSLLPPKRFKNMFFFCKRALSGNCKKTQISKKNKKWTLQAVCSLTLSNPLAPCDPTRDEVVGNPAWGTSCERCNRQVNALQSQSAALVN